MSSIRRPRGLTAKPCQDTLKAFLAEWHMSGLFYHCQLANHLARAGFEVHQVQREDNHAEVWVLKTRRGHVPAGEEIELTQRLVCLFLKRHGLRYPRKEVVVMVEGDRIKAAFNWKPGWPGWVTFQGPKAGPKRRNQTGPGPAR